MKVLIVYESMFGNTHEVATRIAEALAYRAEVSTVPVGEARADLVTGADLLLVGGPTHIHTMSSKTSRASAVDSAAKAGSDLQLDPDAEGPGLRDWFDGLPTCDGVAAAAFDTRMDRSAVLTGRASKGIARRLKKHGCTLLTAPESFLVDDHNHLVAGEADRAAVWAQSLPSLLPV